MKIIGGLLVLMCSAYALAGDKSASTSGKDNIGCYYDGKLNSEGALVSVKAEEIIVLQCVKTTSMKGVDGFIWKTLGVQNRKSDANNSVK